MEWPRFKDGGRQPCESSMQESAGGGRRSRARHRFRQRNGVERDMEERVSRGSQI